ncbi:aldehyde ferredoxin oxidoreductase family protein [Chloroflexota bacterium]
MTEWYGWAGTILDVNLTTVEIKKTPLSKELAAKHIGGGGLAVKILYDELEPGTDPLGPDNILMITQGPLSGTTAPSCGRYGIITKSPQTGIFLRTNGGGFFGPEMKWAGYDLIILRGASKKPVYLCIDDDHVELRDAAHLWGKDTWATQRLIRKELGDEEIQTLKIGPSGENLGLSSCVIGDLSRTAGKGGVGAVWGSKKLKAIAVRGSKGVGIARPNEFMELCLGMLESIQNDPIFSTTSRYGTPATVSDPLVKSGAVPGFDPRGLLSSEFEKGLIDKSLACFNCPVHCTHYYSVKEGKYQGTRGEGLEGATVLFGGYLLKINNPNFVFKYNTVCNQLGLHVDNPGGALAWAMLLWGNGIINKDDTDGIELTWGNEEAVLKMLYKIANMDGFGAVLDAYPRGAAEKLGKDSELYISHSKGMAGWGVGIVKGVDITLAYSTATRGYDHLVGMPTMAEYVYGEMFLKEVADFGLKYYGDSRLTTDPWWVTPKKALLVYDTEHLNALCDSTGICKIPSQWVFITSGYHLDDFARLLSAATGVDYTTENLAQAAEREMLLERAFNAREGIRRIDDYPYLFYWQKTRNEPHPLFQKNPRTADGKYRLSLEDYEGILDEYYRLHGCDTETGIPTRQRLKKLGLDDVAADLKRRGLLPNSKQTGKKR